MSTVTDQPPSSNTSKIRKLVGRLRSSSTRTTPNVSADSSPSLSRSSSFRISTPRASPSPSSSSRRRPRTASGQEAVAAASLELWNTAYDALRDDPGTAGLVMAYETIISQELPDNLKLGGANSSFRGKSSEQRRELLSAIATAGLRKRRSSRASQTDEPAKKVLNAAKLAIEGVSPAYPGAAVAWAGFCTLTPLMLEPILQRDEIHAGLVHVVGRIPFYMHLAQLPADESDQHDTFVRLYRRVLEFEMNCVCVTASSWNAAAKNVVGWSGLGKLTQTILDMDNKVAAMLSRHNAVELGHRLLELNADLDMSSQLPVLVHEDDEQPRPPDEASHHSQATT